MFKPCACVVVVVVFYLTGVTTAAAEEVSHEPPKVYAERLAPQLTPGDPILKLGADRAQKDEPVVGLLHETVRWVDDRGHTCIAIHKIDLAQDDQGATRIAKEAFAYRRTDQKAHLVMARTIQPDGSSQSVAANAAFIQTPQNDADGSLYSDYAELIVVFPNVRANTARESIVVLEEPTPRIDGEFTATLHFAAWWPQARIRHVVELAKGIAGRLAVTPLGSDVPTPRREVANDQSVRLTWDREHAPKTEWESGRAPADQVGPAVFLSTLKDWNAFGEWYRRLLHGRDSAGTELTEAIAARTRGLTDQDAVIGALLTDVARDVRYTGLEFGMSGLQPYDPNEVWAHRYGDCKDKANLLRVMLRAKNVPAYLAFVNTEHAGRVEKRSPDYRHFDHVIVAIERAGGGYSFCDPTIKYAKAGMLRPDDVDRDVLLLKDTSVEFVRTPSQDMGTTTYDLDLKLGSDSGLSGWLTIDADGYDGASLAEYFAGKDHKQARNRALDMVHGFYRTAELIDVDPMPIEKFAGAYRVRAYFTVRGTGGADRSRDTLGFPGADFLVPNFGDQKHRETDRFQWKQTRVVRAAIALPPGWGVAALPRPFRAESAPVRASASWGTRGETVTASFAYEAREDLVSVESYPLLYNTATSLGSWMSKPLAIDRGGARAATTVPSTQPDLANFPLMPTGEGQLELVDRQFPVGTDPSRRQEALRQVLAWFPADKTTAFTANLRLVQLDWRTDSKNPAMIERIRQLLADSRAADVDAEHLAWGDWQLATWLGEAGQKQEATTILTRITADAAVSDFRRGWSAVSAARLLRDVDPVKAIELLERTLDLDSTALPFQYAELADLLVGRGQGGELESRLRTLVQRYPQQSGKVLGHLADRAEEGLSDGKTNLALALLASLDKVVPADAASAPLRGRIAAVRQRAGMLDTYADVAATLKKYIDGHRPAWWDKTVVDPALTTRAQFAAAVEKAGAEPGVEQYLRYGLEYLTRFSPEPEEFGRHLWLVASSLQTHDREPELLDQLLAGLDRFPATDRWRCEGVVTRAGALVKRGKDAEALSVLDTLGTDVQVMPAIRYGAIRRAGEIFERMGKFPDALAKYKRLEEDLGANRKSCDALLHAVLINLELDKRDEARRICTLLARVDPKDVDAATGAVQIRDFVSLSKDPAALEAFWKRQESWWPQWLTLERRLGVPPAAAAGDVVVPAIADATALGRELGFARRASDRPRFFGIVRLVVHAARWEPRYVYDWASIIGLAVQMAPERQAELRSTVIAAMRDLKIADPQIDGAMRVLLAAHLLDSGQPAEALAVARDYLAPVRKRDVITEAMHRIWALAATSNDKELDAAIVALESDLAPGDALPDRPLTVTSLADAYGRRGRQADELDLLKREIANPTIKAEPTSLQSLTLRYENLSHRDDGAKRFPESVAHWMRLQKPAWYDYVHPDSLKDLGSQDPVEVLRQPPGEMLPVEVAKVGLLVAQDASRTLAQRTYGFERAVYIIANFSARHDEVLRLYSSLFNDGGFSEVSRRYWLWQALLDGAELPAVAPLRLHALARGFDATQLEKLNGLVLPGVDPDSAESVESAADRLIERPLGGTQVAQLDHAFRRLLELDVKAGRRVYEKSEHVRLAGQTADSPASIRLKMLRSLKAAEKSAPQVRAVDELVLRHFASQTDPPPSDWRQVRGPRGADLLDRRAALALRLHLLRTGRANCGDLQFLGALLSAADPARDDPAFRAQLFTTLLANEPGDEERATVIAAASTFFDLDQPEQREQMLAAVKAYRDPKQNPAAATAIRTREAYVAIRTGQPLDVEHVSADLSRPVPPAFETWCKLARYVQQHDTRALKGTLEALEPEKLLEPAGLPRTLFALDMAGMNDEAALVREAGRKALYRAVASSWATPSRTEIQTVFALARALDAFDQVPPAWLEHCLSNVHDEKTRARMQLEAADLKHDWPAVVASADVLLAECPREYLFYWYKGNALYKLGRADDGAAALRTFVRYGASELEYPRAMELLSKPTPP